MGSVSQKCIGDHPSSASRVFIFSKKDLLYKSLQDQDTFNSATGQRVNGYIFTEF